MSRIRIAAIVLLVLLGIPLGIVLFRPDLVLGTLSKSSLSQLGYEIEALEVTHLGINSTAINELVLISIDQRIVLDRIHAQYSPSQLIAGTVQSVSVGKIELQLLSDSSNEEPPTSLASLLDTFDALPVSDIYLPNVQILNSEQGYEIGLGLQSPPLRIAGEALLAAPATSVVEFDVNRTTARDLIIESRASIEGDLFLESEIELHVADNALGVAATSSITIAPVQSLIGDFLPANTEFMNDRVSVLSDFEVHDPFGSPSVSELSVIIDSPNSTLQAIQDSDLGSNTLQLRLPIHMQGDIAVTEGPVQLSFSEIYGSGDWFLQGSTSQSEHTFTNTQLNCTSHTDCDLQSEWVSNLISWRYAEYLGSNTQLSAPLSFNYSNNEMRLAADLVEILVPSITGTSESVLSELSTTLQLQDLEMRVGDVVSGGFNFSSSSFRLDNSVVEISNPAYSGKLQLEEDILTGILEIDLDETLRLGIGLQHFFLRDTGDVVLQLAAHEFSETEPLSMLISPMQLDADIIAGEIEGLANISWSKQLDESWRFGGPIALRVDQLSGYYADYLFVDLSTDLFAEATTPLGIQVTNPASASLSRIDIGLPLEDLSWQYRFDTLTREIELIDFDTDLLGGELNIPAARYNPSRDRQQIDVVLADLLVDSLVSLAEYPGLKADGLISGYLPFIIEGESISIERGLVGALKPGGSIRYTPTNSAPSSNQSLQLVNDALSNYQYETMNTEVFYDTDGELLLNVQLQGSNPDMNNGQAINLNVNISDNIPSLLKSLQASRVIEDELARLVDRP